MKKMVLKLDGSGPVQNLYNRAVTRQTYFCVLLLLLLACLPGPHLVAQNWNHIIKAAASDRAEDDFFGHAVSISGEYAIVGAYQEEEDAAGDNPLNRAGAAYIFKRSGTGWVQEAKLVASDREASDEFGWSVSINGEYAIVGAHFEDKDATGGNSVSSAGSAYIFKRTEMGWVQQAKIVAAEREEIDDFGESVSISGEYAIVGAYREDEDAAGDNTLSNAGSAYIFKRSGTSWTQEAKIVAADRAEDVEFGHSVSLSGEYAIVGAYREDEDAEGGNTLNRAGAAYIFKRTEMGWTQQAKLVAADRAANDKFGESVSISGEYAIVGAIGQGQDAEGGNTLGNAGAAYIFKRSGTSWAQQAKIVATDRATGDNFGGSVSISGDYAIVGAIGQDQDAEGGNTLNRAGSAYIFKRSGTFWTQQAKIVASDRAEGDLFGFSVSISGEYAIVGARDEDQDAEGGNTLNRAGSAYFFRACTFITAPTVTQPTCLTPTGTIVVNATGDGTLEYSVNNGGSWSLSPTFSGLAPGEYTLKVRLQANPSCEATYADNPVVLTSPPPVTTANAGSDQTGAATCGLTQVTLAANTPAVGTGSWSIQSGTGGSFGNASDPNSTFTGMAGSTYTLVWTISNSPCASTDEVVITFNQNPTTANAGLDQTGVATCGLTQVTLAANAPTVGTGSWSIQSGTGGSFGNASGPSSTFSGTAGSTYTLIWTISNSSCAASADEVVITFNPTPNAVATPSTQTICSASAITPIVLSGNVSGTTYSWSRDNTGSVTGIAAGGSGNISGSLTNTTNAPMTVTFTITPTADNCPGTPITATVLVNPLPTASISGTTAVCQNAPFPNVTFTASNGTAPYSFSYKINGGADLTVTTSGVNTGVTVAQTTAVANTFNYTLVSVRDAKGCEQLQNGTAIVTVHALPVVSTPQSSLCTGLSMTLSPTSGGTWQSSNPSMASVNNAGVVTGIAPGVVSFTFTQTSTGCSAATANVTIKPTPTSNLTASKVDVCANTEVTLNPNCSIPTPTVNWNPGAPTVTPAAATMPYVYKARCTADGCTGNESSVEVRTHRILVDMKDLDAGALPLPIVRAVKDNMAPTNQINAPVFPRRWTFIANGCDASESAVFTLSGPVNFKAIDNAATYAMFANDAGGFYSIDHPNYGNGGSFPDGTYTLTVDLRSKDGIGGPFPKNRVATGSLLATRSLQFTVNNSQSMAGRQSAVGEELTVEGERRAAAGFAEVFPNPVSHSLRLKVVESKDQKVNVSLMDASGRTMVQRSFVPQTNQHQEEFELSQLSSGMYFLRVNTENKNATLKLVKVD